MDAIWNAPSPEDDAAQATFSFQRLGTAGANLRVCPYLGMADDRATHALFATDEHRCFVATPAPIEAGHQELVCLSDAFASCLHLEVGTREQPEQPVVASKQLGPRVAMKNQPQQAKVVERQAEKHAPSISLKRLVVTTGFGTVLLVGALLAAVAYIGVSMSDDSSAGTDDPSFTLESASAIAPEPATPTAAPSPTAVPPSAASNLLERPSAGTESALPPNQHVVVSGETVDTVAAQYRVSEDALRAANQLTADDVLSVGMTLVIPVGTPTTTDNNDSAIGSESLPATPTDSVPGEDVPPIVVETAPETSDTANQLVAPPALETAPPTQAVPDQEAQATPAAQNGFQTRPPASHPAPGYQVTPPTFQVGQVTPPLVPMPASP
jgi:LysM repeat protein